MGLVLVANYLIFVLLGAVLLGLVNNRRALERNYAEAVRELRKLTIARGRRG